MADGHDVDVKASVGQDGEDGAAAAADSAMVEQWSTSTRSAFRRPIPGMPHTGPPAQDPAEGQLLGRFDRGPRCVHDISDGVQTVQGPGLSPGVRSTGGAGKKHGTLTQPNDRLTVYYLVRRVQHQRGGDMATSADRVIGRRTSVDAFVTALRPYLGDVAAAARRFAPREEADDVAQEALLAAWRYRSRFDPRKGSLRAWLVAIAVTESRKAWGRSLRRDRIAKELTDRSRSAAGDDLRPSGEPEDFAALDAAIAELGRRQREVVGLYYFVDLPIDDVATALGISSGTVKSTLADAREQIRHRLESR